MFASVESLKFGEGKVDEANNLVLDVIIPVLEQQLGFVCQLLLSDTGTGNGISINLWENKRALSNFQAGPVYRKILSKISDLLISPPYKKTFQ